MLSTVFASLAFGSSDEFDAALHNRADYLISDKFLNEVEKLAAGQWKPQKLSHDKMFALLKGGYQKERPDPRMEDYGENVKIVNDSDVSMIEAYVGYDSRTEHSGCIGAIRNQLNCGSCWAFAAAETFSDNQCVQVGDRTQYSAQDLVSCDNTDHGCNGGTLPNVWSWIVDHGITSQTCMPYTAGEGNVASCPDVCPNGGEGIDRNRCSKYNMLDSTDDIKSGIFSAGSVEVGMSVYEDFMSYKSGIYKHKTGQFLGGHAVKAVGWGVQYETKYWIVQNSWGADWGESGYFRIDMSDDETAIGIGGGFNCGIIDPLPTETPTPPPTDCKDISPGSCADITDKSKSCQYMELICEETCGCCQDPILQPSWCPGKTPSSAPARPHLLEAVAAMAAKLE